MSQELLPLISHCPPGAIVESLYLFYSGLTTTRWIQGLLVVVNGGKLSLAVAMHPGQSHASRHWLDQSMDINVYPSCPSRWGHCPSPVILWWVAFITLLPQATNPLTHLHMSGCKLPENTIPPAQVTLYLQSLSRWQSKIYIFNILFEYIVM